MATHAPIPPPEKYFVAFVIQGEDVFRITSDSIVHTCGNSGEQAFQGVAKLRAAAALEQQSAVPFGWQPQLDAGAEFHVRNAGFARADGDAEQTMRRNIRSGRAIATFLPRCNHPLRGVHLIAGCA